VEKRQYDLTPGDSLLFSANLGHRWRNPGRTVANALILLSDFSEAETPHLGLLKGRASANEKRPS